jgi:hypothetical protein
MRRAVPMACFKVDTECKYFEDFLAFSIISHDSIKSLFGAKNHKTHHFQSFS